MSISIKYEFCSIISEIVSQQFLFISLRIHVI